MYSLGDTDELGANAPQPIDEKSLNRGAFEKLAEGDGARQAPRSGAGHSESVRSGRAGQHAPSDQPAPMPKRMLIGLVIAAALVIALCVALFVRVLSAPVPGSEHASSDPLDVIVESAVGTSVSYGGSVYSLAENNGSYALMETHVEGDGQQVVVGNLPGTPVDIVLYGETVLVPENLSDGTWEVSAYTIGAGWTPIVSHDGSVVSGKGAISEATLNGSTLRLAVDGKPVEVPLEW